MEVSARYNNPRPPFLARLPDRHVKHLGGNGMNLQTLAAWFLYCCSMNVVRTERLKLKEEHKLAQDVLSDDAEDDDKQSGASRGEPTEPFEIEAEGED